MTFKKIPNTSVEIKTGLLLNTYVNTIGGVRHTFNELYASEGYCFYDNTLKFYDEEDNLIPDDEVLPTQRVYMTYAHLGIYDKVDNYTPVLIQKDFEIVSLPNVITTGEFDDAKAGLI